MHTIRARQHELCPQCGRYAYSNRDNYCLGCGYSEKSPILGVLFVVGLGLAALALVGWLMS